MKSIEDLRKDLRNMNPGSVLSKGSNVFHVIEGSTIQLPEGCHLISRERKIITTNRHGNQKLVCAIVYDK